MDEKDFRRDGESRKFSIRSARESARAEGDSLVIHPSPLYFDGGEGRYEGETIAFNSRRLRLNGVQQATASP